MTWYSAHIITYVKFLDEDQDTYPIWENVILVNARTLDEAHEIAETEGREIASINDQMTWEDKQPVLEFAGVRKVTELRNLSHATGTPAHCTEVSYSKLEALDEKTLRDFATGMAVNIRYVD